MPSSLAVFARYLLELWRHAEALAGSLLVLLVLWLLDHWGPTWWTHPQPWAYVLVASFGLAVAQYRVWRALLRREEEGPDLRGGLVLEYERPDRQALEAALRFERSAKSGDEIHVLCNAPVLDGSSWVGNLSLADFKILRQRYCVYQIHGNISKGDKMGIRIESSGPIALHQVELVQKGKRPSF